MTIGIRQSLALLTLLLGILFFTLHHAIQNTPPISVEHISDGRTVNFDLPQLEIFLKEYLERVKNGEALSFDQEKSLKRIKAILSISGGENLALVERLIALIDEIIELNSELIYPGDGEHVSDDH